MTAPRKPAKPDRQLRTIRSGMTRATAKFLVGGRENPKFKPITLRRADYERQKDRPE